jgi:hypothetical protein
MLCSERARCRACQSRMPLVHAIIGSIQEENMHEQFVGTKPVDERLRFDVDRLTHYLREHIEGFSGPLEVEQFSGGQSNPTFIHAESGTKPLCPAQETARKAVAIGSCG